MAEKTAVITGGSRGIGKAITLALARDGFNTAIIYRSKDEAALEVKKQAEAFGVKSAAYKCDAADFGACESVLRQIDAELGSISALVNNAGINRDRTIKKMSEEEFDVVIAADLKSVFNMTKHASALMRNGGSIINVSTAVALAGNMGQANYTAAKAGIIGFSRTAARELARFKITCNVLCPGFIETDMTGALSDDIKAAFVKGIPLARAGKPSDIAEAAAFLASDKAAYITGSVLHVDGGMVMG